MPTLLRCALAAALLCLAAATGPDPTLLVVVAAAGLLAYAHSAGVRVLPVRVVSASVSTAYPLDTPILRPACSDPDRPGASRPRAPGHVPGSRS